MMQLSQHISYSRIEGSGPTFLCIHGLGVDHQSWSTFAPLLSRIGEVYLIDLPGYGESSVCNPFTMDTLAASMIQFIYDKSITNPILVGHSMGGQVALHIAALQEVALSALILFAPAGIETFTQEEKKWLLKTLTADWYEQRTKEELEVAIESNFYRKELSIINDIKKWYSSNRNNENRSRQFSEIRSLGIKAMIEHRPDFNALSLPTQIFFGAEDQLIPHPFLHADWKIEDVLINAKQILPDASHHLIQEAGHFVHCDQSKLVWHEIQQFISEVEEYS